MPKRTRESGMKQSGGFQRLRSALFFQVPGKSDQDDNNAGPDQKTGKDGGVEMRTGAGGKIGRSHGGSLTVIGNGWRHDGTLGL